MCCLMAAQGMLVASGRSDKLRASKGTGSATAQQPREPLRSSFGLAPLSMLSRSCMHLNGEQWHQQQPQNCMERTLGGTKVAESDPCMSRAVADVDAAFII